jgi:hypothetical protein
VTVAALVRWHQIRPVAVTVRSRAVVSTWRLRLAPRPVWQSRPKAREDWGQLSGSAPEPSRLQLMQMRLDKPCRPPQMPQPEPDTTTPLGVPDRAVQVVEAVEVEGASKPSYKTRPFSTGRTDTLFSPSLEPRGAAPSGRPHAWSAMLSVSTFCRCRIRCEQR